METKELKIDKQIIKAIFISFICSFLLMFVIEHFGGFSYTPSVSNSYNNGRIVISETYYPAQTPVATLYQKTPFGTTIQIPTNGMMSSELEFSDTEFKSYSNKSILYLKAVFKDFIYWMLIWVLFSTALIFFKKYKVNIK